MQIQTRMLSGSLLSLALAACSGAGPNAQQGPGGSPYDWGQAAWTLPPLPGAPAGTVAQSIVVSVKNEVTAVKDVVKAHLEITTAGGCMAQDIEWPRTLDPNSSPSITIKTDRDGMSWAIGQLEAASKCSLNSTGAVEINQERMRSAMLSPAPAGLGAVLLDPALFSNKTDAAADKILLQDLTSAMQALEAGSRSILVRGPTPAMHVGAIVDIEAHKFIGIAYSTMWLRKPSPQGIAAGFKVHGNQYVPLQMDSHDTVWSEIRTKAVCALDDAKPKNYLKPKNPTAEETKAEETMLAGVKAKVLSSWMNGELADCPAKK